MIHIICVIFPNYMDTLSLNECLYIYRYLYVLCRLHGCNPQFRDPKKKEPRNDAQFKQCTPGLKALQSLWTSDGEGNPVPLTGFVAGIFGGCWGIRREKPTVWMYK